MATATIPLIIKSDVSVAREEAMELAKEMGMDRLSVGEVALAISEICQNAIRYANGGVAKISSLKNGRVLRIEVVDEGPGIPDLTKAFRQGYSSAIASLGVGFGAAKRSMDLLKVKTKVGKGTKVIMEKYLPLAQDEFEGAAVSMADEDYLVNGDAFLIKEFDGDKVLLAVIDGLGQGKEAHQMSNRVKKLLLDISPHMLPEKMIEQCHIDLQKNKEEDGGVAMSIAILTPGKLHYLGIGDTHAYLLNGSFQPMENTDGRVGGRQLRTLTTQTLSFKNDITFLLCTDGISSQIKAEELNWHQSSQLLATQVFNLYNRPYGDATVLAAKYYLA